MFFLIDVIHNPRCQFHLNARGFFAYIFLNVTIISVYKIASLHKNISAILLRRRLINQRNQQ